MPSDCRRLKFRKGPPLVCCQTSPTTVECEPVGGRFGRKLHRVPRKRRK